MLLGLYDFTDLFWNKGREGVGVGVGGIVTAVPMSLSSALEPDLPLAECSLEI